MNTAIFLLQGIPETIGILALSLTLARIPLRWLPISIGGAIISIISSTIRLLPFALGLHTVALLLMCVFFIAKATSVSTSKSFIVAISGVITLIFFEIVIHLSIVKLTTLNLEAIPNDSLLWLLIGMPQAIAMLVLAILVSRIKKPITNGWKI